MIRKLYLRLYYLLQRLWLKIALKDENQVFSRSLKGLKFECSNKWAYLSALQEIYIDETYAIDPRISVDNILDIGANFGFSVAFLKQKYPNSRIVAFEADGEIFKFLNKNVTQNNLTNVELINGAAWIKDDTLTFHQDCSQGGSLIKSDLHSKSMSVKAYDIRRYTDKKWDLLKLDVEGSETAIIEHIGNNLRNFKLVFIEYHEHKAEVGSLSKILSQLEANGFKYSFQPIFGSESLFQEYKANKAFDLQLNIFAIKKDLLKDLSINQ